jgi:hypothetical protein
MPLEQKTVRRSDQLLLDIEVNKLLKEGWKLSSDVKCVISQINYYSGSSSNTEIWYQTLTKYFE